MKKIYSEIGRTIMSYDKYFKVFMKRELEPLGLNVAAAMVLMALYEKDGLTQDELISTLHYDKSVMTRAIQSLEKKAYIDRVQNPADGRGWILKLTTEGAGLKQEILGALRKWCGKAFKGIENNRAEELLETMNGIVINIEK